MPYGQLTPLGRHLRSVLAKLSCASSRAIQPRTTRHQLHPERHGPGKHVAASHGLRKLHTTSVTKRPAVAPAIEPSEDEAKEQPTPQNGRRFREHSWRRLKKRRRVDHLTAALRDAGSDAALPYKPLRKPDLTYTNVQSRAAWKDATERQRRHADDHVPDAAQSQELSLQRMLASHIRDKGSGPGRAEAKDEFAPSYSPFADSPLDLAAASTEVVVTPGPTADSKLDSDFLRFKGVAPEDVGAWADILSAEDSLNATQKLARHAEAFGVESVPTFVYMHLLRREYHSARSLRILIKHAYTLFGQRLQHPQTPGIVNQPLFLAVVRLIRHAREVWPQSMTSIAELFLRHLRHLENGRRFDTEQLQKVTYLCNKLMSLMSLSTAVQPFKDNPHQEAAIVPILRYMAERNLHINRQGYRAVIRVQLPQRKTHNEQQWADLKALSWPPWKEDRTAMDATIDLEYGRSRANATLIRMREAGYRPLYWEKIAELYTGWDVDRTPTIQMRALLGQPGARLSTMLTADKRIKPWAARVASTRTIQEAWACYLAWEDRKLPPDQDVYLAIFTKLLAEEKRQRTSTRGVLKGTRSQWSLQPGDSRTISPLPPSTHLYTYTRTPPPTVEDFYTALHGRGVVLEEHCLGHLVRTASTLQFGVRCLKDGRRRYPGIQSLLSLDPSDGLLALPTPILVAAVELFSRFARVPYSKASPDHRYGSAQLEAAQPFLLDHRLNQNNPMTRVIELLRRNPRSHRPLWNVAYQGLTREANFPSMVNAIRSNLETARNEYFGLPDNLRPHAGALNAYRLLRRILSLQREHHVDLDIFGFHNLCLSTEHMTVAAWTILQAESADGAEHQMGLAPLRQEAKELLRSKSHHARLKGEFRILVGAAEVGDHEAPREPPTLQKLAELMSPGLPRLLTIPGPAILHAYVRALGWLADYDGLLTLVRWMRDHRDELAERQSHDRLGQDMMRKAIVALRVFLERSWLSDARPGFKVEVAEDKTDDGETAGNAGRTEKTLTRLRSPASLGIVAEVKVIVESVEGWEGWPEDEEVEQYAADKRFKPFR